MGVVLPIVALTQMGCWLVMVLNWVWAGLGQKPGWGKNQAGFGQGWAKNQRLGWVRA
jgi:hypothetical protein